MPAGQALIPNLVPKALLLNGIALNQAAQHGSRLLGPLAIAPVLNPSQTAAWLGLDSLAELLGRFGAEGAFFLCTGLYVISLVQTLRIRTASTGKIDKKQNRGIHDKSNRYKSKKFLIII